MCRYECGYLRTERGKFAGRALEQQVRQACTCRSWLSKPLPPAAKFLMFAPVITFLQILLRVQASTRLQLLSFPSYCSQHSPNLLHIHLVYPIMHNVGLFCDLNRNQHVNEPWHANMSRLTMLFFPFMYPLCTTRRPSCLLQSPPWPMSRSNHI